MKHIIESPPRTMMEVFKMLPEGTLAELIDNQLYMAPSPNLEHQDSLLDIAAALRSAIAKKDGKVIVSPFDVYLDENQNAVQPDIILILKDNFGIIHQEGHIHGVPDLLIEILSPGNKKHDLITKKALYEKFGVKEYWIVDPQTKLALGYQLNDGVYKLIAEEVGFIKSPLLDTIINF